MTNPRKTQVDVTYKGIDPSTGKAKFDITPTGSNPLPVSNGCLVFDNDRHPGFQISFILTDDTKQGYEFPSDKKQAISSELGATDLCPPQGKNDVFQPLEVGGNNNNTLDVLNKNVKPDLGDFGYALWITNDKGTSYTKLDPGGINNNGPTSRFSLYTVVAVAVAGAVIGAAAAMVASPAARPVNVVAYALGGAIIALIVYYAVRGSRERMA